LDLDVQKNVRQCIRKFN